MGIPGSANPMLLAGAAGAYEIDQSLRFNSADSTNLTRNISTTGNRRTFTISFWFKSVVSNSDGGFVATDGNILASNYIEFELNSSNKLQFRYSTGNARSTTAVFRDPSAWYHIVFAVDTTQATDTNRIRVYVNGTEYATTGDAYPAQNFDTNFNTAGVAAQIGHSRDNSGNPAKYLSGYIAEYNHIDGQQLTPSSFGETDTITGAWIPKKYSGSYGTNGFYLKFEGSGIGSDSSGNGNTWTANNFTTSGTGTDVMSDTPTTNYATLNPAFKNINTGNTYTEGNLVATNGTGAYSFIFNSTIPVSSGKWYAECTMSGYSGTPSPTIGVQDAGNKKDVGNELVGAETGDVGYDLRVGKIYKDGNYNYATGYTTATSGDIIGIKLDLDGNTIEFLKNNTSVGSAVAIATGTGLKVFAGGQGDGSSGIGCTFTWNFGQRAFAYTPPTGYKALNTANLPEPTIKDGGKYFDTKLYTGNGSTQTLTGLNFSPDLVWIKDRNQGYNHYLVDQVRGFNGSNARVIQPNLTNAEESGAGIGEAFTAFTSDGFSVATVGGWYGTNQNTVPYVAWAWDAGGTGSSNNAGTITSTVSANASAGFSIVTYTSQVSTKPVSVGHGLGVKPSMIICKNRDAASAWPVYHSALGATKAVFLNSTSASSTSIDYWNDTEPTSTVFTVYDSTGTHAYGTSNKMIAYCFSEVAGYSKFGSYVGNGSSDGPFVFLGFRPAFLMWKKSSDTSNWLIWDTARDTYNAADSVLKPNSSAEEETNSVFNYDLLSNGFKVRTGSATINDNGATYIFAAFAELPFKYSNAR